MKDWVKDCCKHVSKQKFGVDKQRTKELGEKCYWVEFYENNLHFNTIPDVVSILSIDDEDGFTYGASRVTIDCTKLNSLNKLQSTHFKNKNNILRISIRNIKDNEIVIPEGITYLTIGHHDKITRLPKELNCGISIGESQTNHLTKVNGDFMFANNTAKSFGQLPKEVTGNCDCHFTHASNLVGSPEYVGGTFTCSNTGTLKSLKGCPKKIDGDFNFYSTGITKIDDFPDYVGGNINLSGCCHLENFVGLPDKINGNLDIGYCKVGSIDGIPTDVKEFVFVKELTFNDKNETPITPEMIIEKYPDLKGKIKLSQFDVKIY